MTGYPTNSAVVKCKLVPRNVLVPGIDLGVQKARVAQVVGNLAAQVLAFGKKDVTMYLPCLPHNLCIRNRLIDRVG